MKTMSYLGNVPSIFKVNFLVLVKDARLITPETEVLYSEYEIRGRVSFITPVCFNPGEEGPLAGARAYCIMFRGAMRYSSRCHEAVISAVSMFSVGMSAQQLKTRGRAGFVRLALRAYLNVVWM